MDDTLLHIRCRQRLFRSAACPDCLKIEGKVSYKNCENRGTLDSVQRIHFGPNFRGKTTIMLKPWNKEQTGINADNLRKHNV